MADARRIFLGRKIGLHFWEVNSAACWEAITKWRKAREHPRTIPDFQAGPQPELTVLLLGEFLESAITTGKADLV
jgi:hypothetical protein